MKTFTQYGTAERQKLVLLNNQLSKYEFEYSTTESYEHWDARFFYENQWTYLETKCRTSYYDHFMIEINKFNYLKQIQEELDAKIFYINFVQNYAYFNNLTNLDSKMLVKEFIKRKATTATDGSKQEKTGYVYLLNEPETKIRIY